jgi:hypothetical protein
VLLPFGFVCLVDAGCVGKHCDDGPHEPAGVYVVDGQTGVPVCSATVTVREGSEWVPLSSTGCTGIYVFEYRPGDFEVRVAAPGYEDEQLVVEVTQDDCEMLHVRGDGPRDGQPGYANLVTVPLVSS